ncbi:MAG: hypothetical protein P8H35_05930 [Flavobacteriales bacterium]|nr:hypothetical protein [Flavobacteriales bacterium]
MSLISVTLFFISGVINISISQVKYVYHEKPTSILINYSSKYKKSKKIPTQLRSSISSNSLTKKITRSGVEIINGSTLISTEPKKPNSELAQLKSEQKLNSNVSIVNISAVEVVNSKNLVEDGSIIEKSVIDYTAFQKLLDDKSTVIFKNDFESNIETEEDLVINEVEEEIQEEVVEESKVEEFIVNENAEVEIKEAVKEFPDGVKELKDDDNPEEEKTLNNNLQYTAHVEGDLSNSEFYYTVNIKTVSGPVEGLNFLTQVRDGDEIWDEYAFHLFKDAKNATKITLGKFAEREKATEIMNYLKTKNISNPTVEKFDNDMKIKSSAKSPPASKKIVSKTSSDLITVKTDENLKLNPNTASLEKENKPKIISSTASPDKRTGSIAEDLSANINSSDNFYTVQVGAVDKISSNNIEGINLKKENLFFSDIGNLGYAINYGKYDNYENARIEAVNLHNNGEVSAFVTKYANDRRVKVSVADYSSENVSENTIKDDIEKLGYKPVTAQMKGKFIQLATVYNWDSHNFKTTFDSLERTVYFKINKSHAVQFFVGPFNQSDLFIELRNVKNTIPDAFVKTI